MKFKIWKTLLAGLIIFHFAEGCKKDVDIFNVTQVIINSVTSDTTWLQENSITDTNTVRKIAANISIPSEFDSVNITKGDTIVTSDNVTVYIPAQACVNPTGAAATGKAQMEFLLIRKKGDMIRADKPTVAYDGSVLASGGEIYLRFMQNGQELALASGKSVRLKYRDAQTDPQMKFFYGTALNINQFVWVGPVSGDNQSVRPWIDSTRNTPSVAGYEVFTNRLHWINCDKLYSDTLKLTRVCVQISADSFTNANTLTFLVFRDINSVVKLWGDPANKKFCIPANYKGVPIGKVVTVVTLSKIGNNYYLGALPNITITANQVIPIVPTIAAPTQIAYYLSTL